MRKTRVAVIGVGHLGRIHARLLSTLDAFQLVGVVDSDPGQRALVAEACRARPCADYRELLGQIDAAVVAVPTRWHHEIALDLIDHGVHAFVEKPLCTTRAQAQDLVSRARQRGVVLQVGHVERFNPAWSAALPHLREPRFIRATRQGGFSFRSTDVGVVLDLMIHDLDLVLSLVRSNVARVEASGMALFGQHEDVAEARLVFENGCQAQLSASRASRVSSRAMQIHCERAWVEVDFANRAVQLARPSEAVLRHELDVETMSRPEREQLKDRLLDLHLPAEAVPVVQGDALTAELVDFADSLRTGRAPRVRGEDGLANLSVAEQILASLRHNSWQARRAAEPPAIAAGVSEPAHGPHWGLKPALPAAELREAS